MESRADVLAVTINASFVHTSPASRILRNIARDELGLTTASLEFSLGEPQWKMAEAILSRNPRVVGFSVYIWNRDTTLALLSRLRAMRPELLLVLGGPELWFESELPADADLLVRGEGERHWIDLLRRFFAGEKVRGHILGDAELDETMEPCTAVYRDEDLAKMRGRFAYLETSRGCPFRCAFCLSGRSSCRLRFSNDDADGLVDTVQRLRDHGVRTIKFLDRTFNANPRRALELWRALARVDGMGFHFEVEAALLDDDALAFLRTVPHGMFQFEVGVQSLRGETLRAIGRRDDVEVVLERLRQLVAAGTVHLHADLIWGLPGDDVDSVAVGFNRLFSTGVHELQLGFLKLLPGAPIRAAVEGTDYRFESRPPYEVLVSDALSADDLRRLRRFEHVFNLYSNSKRYPRTIAYLLDFLRREPFRFFSELADAFQESGSFSVSLSVEQQIDILLPLFSDAPLLRDYLLLDYVTSQNVFTVPKSLRNELEISRELKAQFKATSQLQLVTFVHLLDCENGKFYGVEEPAVYLVERRADGPYALGGAKIRRVD